TGRQSPRIDRGVTARKLVHQNWSMRARRQRTSFARPRPEYAHDHPLPTAPPRTLCRAITRIKLLKDCPESKGGTEGSRETRRWREMDSNHRSPCMVSSVGEPCHGTSGGVRGTGSAAAVDRAFSCSASHSMQPGAYAVFTGGGLLCCAAVSASW